MNNLIYFLAEEDGAFTNAIRGFFAGIIKFIYRLFSNAIDLMYDLANFDFGFDDYINKLSEKIFFILVIFMIFRLSISILNYIIKPDDFTDSNKGFQKIIFRVIITIMMLIFINPLFNLLTDLQSQILDSDFITTVLGDTQYGKTIKFTNGVYAYGVRMNDDCAKDKYVYTFSKGDHIGLLLLKPFIQPYSREEIGQDYYDKYIIPSINGEGGGKYDGKYCGIVWDDSKTVNYIEGSNPKTSLKIAIEGPNSAEGFMYKTYYNELAGYNDGDKNYYMYDFNYFLALIVGIVGILVIVSFCFDVVIRACSLLLYKIIAPIPIISYISPQGKTSEMFGNWLKKVLSTWASLFIRIAVLDISITFIGIASTKLDNSEASLTMQIFLVLGILMFAKKLPQLLEEIIPGLKLGGGFQLNPFKRISKDALGGNMALGVGAALAAAGMSGLTNGIQRTGQTIGNVRNANGFRAKLGAATSGIGRTIGSTVAGATRGGINAFGRTSKDGRIFNGAWNGYQTSMFSKKLREDNLRKAGLEDANVFKRAKFGIGSMTSDLARYAGVLNKGQREDLIAAEEDAEVKRMQDALDLDKYNLSQAKASALEPYQQYAGYASKIKSRIDNSKAVKDAENELERARAIGDERAILNAEWNLDEAKKFVANDLYNNDRDVRDLVKRMTEIRNSNEKLKLKTFAAFKYNEDKQQYEFDSKSIYSTQNEASIIERTFEDSEREFKTRQEEINEIKRNYANDEAHNPMSRAKLQNSSRMNPEPEKAGFKATPNQSAQANISDNSMYSNLSGTSHNHGGGPVPPPPPGGHNP